MSIAPWIGIAPTDVATGDLKRAYDKILATRLSVARRAAA